jgi:large subunit ribosomal protein L4
LTSKAKAGSIIVIEDIKWDAPKTKNFTGVLNGLDLAGRKSVFVIAEDNQNVYLSSRNVQKTKVMRAQDLSTYDVMNSGTLVISEGAIEKIKATFAN